MPTWGSDLESLFPIFTASAGRSTTPSTAGRAVSGWTAPVHPRIVVVVGIPDVVVDTMSSPASPASGPSSAPPVPASIVVVVVVVVVDPIVPSVGAGTSSLPPSPHPATPRTTASSQARASQGRIPNVVR